MGVGGHEGVGSVEGEVREGAGGKPEVGYTFQLDCLE